MSKIDEYIQVNEAKAASILEKNILIQKQKLMMQACFQDNKKKMALKSFKAIKL